MNEWKDIHDKKPQYGDPILIKIDDVVQYDTYMLDGSDDSLDWLEMYCKHLDDEIKKEFAFFVSHDVDVMWMNIPK